ncbi:unnamed protein product [Caenorhabditis angaria]|uniref:Glycosyltransferase family 92 protein n=1 Tax=Caenorhabditis angaria TaxID=860376 RepID=A0A9P1N2J3_9PELO|nr:unnamed protein product [Caenorhabditis angaria]
MRRYPKNLLIFLAFFIVFFKIIPEILEVWGPLEIKYDSNIFIYSAYYYPNSKSLGENAIAINMVIDQNAFDKPEKLKIHIIGENSTTFDNFEGRIQIDGIQVCSLITTVLLTNTLPNLETLKIQSGSQEIEIPFRSPKFTSPSPVIICISPQFVAEQWQLFLFHIHVIRKFKGHAHFYITSIVDTYFEMVSKYEELGWITIDFWNRIDFGDESEPMRNVEWRNQAGAQTDCLLQYKEVADYIAFFDLDDILIPESHPTYIQEFTHEFSLYPEDQKSYLFYERQVHKMKDMRRKFDFTNLLLEKHIEVNMGKSVIRPEKFNSTWIHFSWNVDFEKGINVKSHFMKHVKIVENVSNAARKLKIAEKLQSGFERIHKNLSLHKMPTNFYFNLIRTCYNEIYYKTGFIQGKLNSKCLNPESCDYPQVKRIKCVHSDAKYEHGPKMGRFTFHWIEKQFWNRTYGCYP